MIFQSFSPRRGRMVNVIKALISTSDRAPIFHMKISVSDVTAYPSPNPHGDTSFPSIKDREEHAERRRIPGANRSSWIDTSTGHRDSPLHAT